MVSEETTLQSLLRNRKIVRNYKESKLEFPQLSEVAEHAIKIPTAGFSRGIEIVHISEKENIITIRPENIQISTQNEFDHNSFKGIIKSVIFSGTHTRYKISIDNIELECSLQSVGIKNIKENDKVYIHLPKNKIWGMNG